MTKRKANPQPSAHPPVLTNAIAAYVASRGADGASRNEIADAVGKPTMNVNQCLYARLLPQARIFQAGPNKHYRFFADKSLADAYTERWPAIMVVIKAERKERQKANQARYQERLRMTKLQKVVELIAQAGPAGITRAEIDAAIGSRDSSQTISDACRSGTAFAAGPLKWRRYFGNKLQAAAWDSAAEAIRAEHLRATVKANTERNKPAKRERDRQYRAEARQKRQSTERARNSLSVVPGRDAPVNIKAPTKANMKDAAIVIPSHVKIQRGPAWTHDARYSVAPGRRIIGEFTAEWRQRRSA